MADSNSQDDIELKKTAEIPTSSGRTAYYASAKDYGPSAGNPLVLQDGCNHGHPTYDEALTCAKNRKVGVILHVIYVPEERTNAGSKRGSAPEYDAANDASVRGNLKPS